MTQEDITILRVHKSTRNRLKRLAITARESYDEILTRLLGGQEIEPDDDLQKAKQELLKKGISKDLVDLLGVIPYKTGPEDDKRMIGRAIRRRYGIE